MNLLEKVYIWLSMSDLPVKKLYEFALSFDNIEDLWEINSYTPEVMKYFDGQEFQDFVNLRDGGGFDKLIENIEQAKVNYITINDPRYPQCLLQLSQPPLILYYKGNIDLLNSRKFSIVGSRVCTRYGVEQAQRFGHDMSKAGFTIVSGLAEGIDGNSHVGVLKAKGKTIGVLAGGLNYIFPAINVELARDIAEKGGLIISEKAPDVQPKSFSFIQRNRLISALSEGVLVVEAGAHSGTIHTVNFSLDLGKSVFALPGNCNSKQSEGTNALIKEFYSCCVTNPEEIISALDEIYDAQNPNESQKQKIEKVDISFRLSPDEKAIVEFLQIEDKHFDELVENLKINSKKLIGLLTTMEIRGLIKKLPGNYYQIGDKI